MIELHMNIVTQMGPVTLRLVALARDVESTQALAHVASSRIIVYTVSRWDRTQYLMSYSTVQYGAVKYGTVQYGTVRYSTVT
jgi:hypothetical protein